MTIKEFKLNLIKTIFLFIIFYAVIFYFINIIFITSLLSFLLIEILFGSWLFKNNFSSIIIPRNITKVWNPKHYKSTHSAMYKRDHYGLRGDYKKISDIEIVAIGGSTTDERWIDEKLTWTYLLQEELNKKGIKIKIANAGVDGQSTLGHMYNFDLWFNKIPNFKPKIFLLYIGINDSAVLFRSLNSNKFEQFIYRSDYLVDIKKTDKFFRFIKNNSYFYKIVKVIIGHRAAKKYNLIHLTETWENTKTTQPFFLTKDARTSELLSNYSSRLETLINKIREFGSDIIVITQSVKKQNILFNCLRLINSETKTVCKKKNIKCLPLDEEINFSQNEDFYDDVHTRPVGNEKIAKYIADNLGKLC